MCTVSDIFAVFISDPFYLWYLFTVFQIQVMLFTYFRYCSRYLFISNIVYRKCLHYFRCFYIFSACLVYMLIFIYFRYFSCYFLVSFHFLLTWLCFLAHPVEDFKCRFYYLLKILLCEKLYKKIHIGWGESTIVCSVFFECFRSQFSALEKFTIEKQIKQKGCERECKLYELLSVVLR